MKKAQLLRRLLAEKPILKIMGAHNALGAKLIEKAGFDGIWSSGFEIATAHGVPDANILTMTENLEAAQNIDGGTSVPVICDCDTGFGNAINVMHMIKKYEAAGIAAVVIEDKCFPKMNSFIPGRQDLAGIEEFAGKIEAAKSACAGPDGIMVFARIEALIAGWGMEEAVKRALAYEKAGADGLVIHSKSKTPDEIFQFASLYKQQSARHCPLIAIPTTYYNVTSNELAQAGFKIAIYANQGMRASVKSMQRVFQVIADTGTTRDIENEISTMSELFQLQGMQSYQENEKRYSPETEKIEAVIPAAADHKFQSDLAAVLQDLPLCMLPVDGKPLIQRQTEILTSAGIQNFSLVVGHQKEKISAKDCKIIDSPDYQTTGSAYSVMRGLEKATGKTLVCYSDILFDQKIAEDLLKSPHPVTIVMDRAFKTLPRRDKQLDLVSSSENAGSPATRSMNPGNFKSVTEIGKKIDHDKAQYEFIGMMLLSKDGVELLKNAWTNVLKEYSNKPFYESPNALKASLTDLLQYLIDQQKGVQGLVIEHGWSEIYSLDDYERVNRFYSEKKSPHLAFTP